jgi:protein-disulfide isomerase
MEDPLPLSTEAESNSSAPAERPQRRRFSLYLGLIPLTFGLGMLAGYLLWGQSPAVAASTSDVAASAPSGEEAAAVIPQAVTRYDIPTAGSPALGPADAPITIVEFSDYECPYCRRWHLETLPRLRAAYPEQLRFVFRDFPITSIHANAAPAAEAAHCAGEQDAFWEFNEKLFTMELGLSPSAYKQYASGLGLDEQAFGECVDERRYAKDVQDDFEFAANLGIRSTPTFFINGIALVGAQPFEVFQQVIDLELAGEIP